MLTCTRRLEWDAMHRIPNHEQACKAFHGHRFVAEVTCAAEELDDRGRIIDFGVIKAVLGTWIDTHWDHTGLLMRGDDDPAVQLLAASNARHGKPIYWLDDPPTAEHLVVELARVAQELLAPHGVQISQVRLWETPNCSAQWRA